jgi:hypothetical protein
MVCLQDEAAGMSGRCLDSCMEAVPATNCAASSDAGDFQGFSWVSHARVIAKLTAAQKSCIYSQLVESLCEKSVLKPSTCEYV